MTTSVHAWLARKRLQVAMRADAPVQPSALTTKSGGRSAIAVTASAVSRCTRRAATALWLTMSSPVFAAETSPTVTSTGGVFQMIIGLLVVLGVLIGGALLLRRFISLPTTTNSPLKIVTGLSLSPRDRLLVVQVGEKQILLGLSPGRIQTLHVLDQPLDQNAPPDSPLSQFGHKFGALLQSQLKKSP